MMANVKHILKDGREVQDIENRVIKVDDFKPLYEAIKRIQKEGEKEHHDQNYL